MAYMFRQKITALFMSEKESYPDDISSCNHQEAGEIQWLAYSVVP